MAEARRGEQEEGERSRTLPTDHPERTKPDHLQSSQGPLSSIRAVIKRTRTSSHTDHTRDRRRPEITIVSAEPLDGNNWFSGASVGFPASQSRWSPGIRVVSQVIKEKTEEEQTVKPTAAPRRFACTATSATQTEPVREVGGSAGSQCSATTHSTKKRSAGKKPQKPPRPSLPQPIGKEPATEPGGISARKSASNPGTSANTEPPRDLKTEEQEVIQEDSNHTCSRSVTVHWDSPTKRPDTQADATLSNSDSKQGRTPIPLPRTKSRKQPLTVEDSVQTLVKICETSDDIEVCTDTDPEGVSSNEYLEELLQVFIVKNQDKEEQEEEEEENIRSHHVSQGEDAGIEMSNSNSQRNIRARIQAFENQAGSEDGRESEHIQPQPQPRKTNRPPVAAKPSVALKPQFSQSLDNNNVSVYQNISNEENNQNPTPAPRPAPPKKPVGQPLKQELESLLSKGGAPHRSRPPMLTRANSVYDEEPTAAAAPVPPVKPFMEPLKPNLNINNHNSTTVHENEYVDSPTSVPVKPQSNGSSFSRQSVTRRPTTIRVPSRVGSVGDIFPDSPPPLPTQKPVGSLNTSLNHKQTPSPILPSQEAFSTGPEPSLPPRRHSTSKILPPRPPPAKTGPGRPPPPNLQATGRSRSVPWDASPKSTSQRPHRKGPVLPPRPNPGHLLYNKYTLQLPHGIASFDYNGSNTGELSFQKNEVLLLMEELDHSTYECQVGDTRGRVSKSRMKVINPLDSVASFPTSQVATPDSSRHDNGMRAQATHDFTPEGPEELGLRAGDVVSMVEQVDNDWYRGTCRGSTGFFPINYVKILTDSPKSIPERTPRPPPSVTTVTGPRCVARFDFEGDNSEELTFNEGDVIQLKAYVGEEWARGQIGASVGIFPLNFVEIIEDLPPPPTQQQAQPTRIALPGMAASPSTHHEAAKPAQMSQSSVEWAVALYDFTGKTDGDLSIQQGDRILITQHIDAEWSCGRLNGREGMFPRAFVESSTAGQQSPNIQRNGAVGAGRGRAMFDFTSNCEEELSLQVGDIVTNLESIDDEWFLGDLRGKRALVPKNYVQVLG